MLKKLSLLLIILITFILIGCQKNNLNTAITQEGVVQEENQDDPLVNYALNAIDFEFVSDSGYYLTYDRIANESYSNKKMIEDIEILNGFIEEQNFSELRETILTVPDHNNLMKEIKVNYIVPILMHENNYLDALRIVYEKEKIETQDNRFVFDLIYLMRYMYVNNGLEYSIDVVDQLKEAYPHQNVSYVWLAISPRQYEYLNDYGIVCPPKEDSDRNKIWRYLVDHYSDDPNIDYAYYFLGNYQKIIDAYPDSDLLEKAYYARAYTLYNKIITVIHKNKDHLDPVDLAIVKNYYESYLRKFSTDQSFKKALPDIDYLCYLMFREYGDDEHYFDFINAIMTMDIYSYRKNMMVNEILESMRSTILSNKDLVRLSEKGEAFLQNEEFSNQSKYYVWSGLANNAFYEGELELADMYFRKMEMSYLNEFDLRRLVILSELKNELNQLDAESLFKIGETLRSYDEYFASVYIYDKLVKLNVSDEDLSKAYMLKASSSKKNRMYEEMLESYKYIVDHLGKTSFADDALAEIGVHYLLAEKDYEKSREIFKQVIEKYPERNAVNNSYNWIAWSYLQEKDYENALIAYEELRDEFPTNRFGKNAIPNINKIKKILAEEE